MSDDPTMNIGVGEALKRAYEADAAAAEANRLAKEAKGEKAKWRIIAEAKLEEAGLTSGVAETDDGRRAMFYQVHKPKFDIIDREAVREWAITEDESYVDPEPALRERLVFEECRRRDEEGLPLPPGIAKRTETEFHKKTL